MWWTSQQFMKTFNSLRRWLNLKAKLPRLQGYSSMPKFIDLSVEEEEKGDLLSVLVISYVYVRQIY